MSVAFFKFLSTSGKRRALYTSLAPILTDVSLRDGIQTADPDYYLTPQKKDLFHTILFQENPANMEVGSLSSLPIMSDSLEIHKYASNQEWEANRRVIMDLFDDKERNAPTLDKKYFLLIPSLKQLSFALDSGVKHLSFITSVSNPFQIKNVNKSVEETKTEFSEMFVLYPHIATLYTKLYISCIRECPITGPIDLDWIVKEIIYYHEKYPFDEICLSDTCGSLTYDDFEYILETIHIFGVPYSKVALHLHVSKNSTHIDPILRYCFRSGIRKFDVSLLNTGGCSITMTKDTCHSNLSYTQFYAILTKYIEARD